MQWILVALIGLSAVALLARHFGLGVRRKHGGCPGCNSCEGVKKATP
ncbi:MAG: hypothetical protein M3R04_06415 [bacterium]|nr:hypothetical protein [bacterium]